jgi:hypothetical protein
MRVRLTKNILVSAFILLVLIGCQQSSYESNFNRSLGDALSVAVRKGSLVDLKDISEFDWDSVFIFPPYTSQSEINQALGYEWKDSQKTGISSDDTINLMVFVEGGEVKRYCRVSRKVADFRLPAGKRSFDRFQARFAVHQYDDSGRYLLEAAE